MHFPLAFALALSTSVASALALPHTQRGIFDKSQNVTSSITVKGSVDDAIAALHDFQLMIDLNPLVTSSTVDPNDPNKFTITDKLSLPLGLSVNTTYNATFESVADGMNTQSEASAGVKIANQWRAVAVPEGTNVTETDTVTANILFSPFIVSEIQKSHGELLDAFAEKLGGKV